MKTLDVIFRIGKNFIGDDGQVTAVFPSEAGTRDPNTATCYAHVGQHGACSRDWYRTTRAATLEEYAPLLRELKGIYETGADAVCLRAVSRWTVRHDRLRLEGLK